MTLDELFAIVEKQQEMIISLGSICDSQQTALKLLSEQIKRVPKKGWKSDSYLESSIRAAALACLAKGTR